MSKKHFGRWVIVLFLLAALPGMTAVMAQGQEPAVKEMPAESVTPADPAEWGETSVFYSTWEAENNNTKANAQPIAFGAVVGGDLYNGDVDWYMFEIPSHMAGMGVVINTDAVMDGETTDTVVKLFDSSAATDPMSMNDDMWASHGHYDSLLFSVLPAGQYYVQVTDHPNSGDCTADCHYE